MTRIGMKLTTGPTLTTPTSPAPTPCSKTSVATPRDAPTVSR